MEAAAGSARRSAKLEYVWNGELCSMQADLKAMVVARFESLSLLQILLILLYVVVSIVQRLIPLVHPPLHTRLSTCSVKQQHCAPMQQWKQAVTE